MSDAGLLVARERESRSVANFWGDLRESLRHPEFWALSSWLEIVVRARKSRLGMVWLLMPSIVYVFGLGTFFSSMQGHGIGHFAAHVALGAMSFRTLMSSVTESSGLFAGSRSFILDGHTRLTDYLLESLAKSFFHFCMFIPVTVVALVMFGNVLPAGLALAPLALLVTYLNGLWIAVVFGHIGARFPDFGQFVGNVTVFVFLLTPIIWYPENMPADSMRGTFMRMNPFYHFVTLFRAPILGEPIEPLTLWFVGILTVVGLAFGAFVYRRYSRYVPIWI
jgi:ABC-type polysaccharide/polyol phosphate export permease